MPARSYRLIALVLWFLIFALCSGRTVSAQSSRTPEMQVWYRAYGACFDKRHNPVPDKMRDLINRLEAAQNWAKDNTGAVDSRYFVDLLAEAHLSLGELEQARRYSLLLLAPPDAQTRDQGYFYTVWFVKQANLRLAGISAVQKDWPRATYYYVQWVRLFCVYSVGPPTVLCLGWMALWWFGA